MNEYLINTELAEIMTARGGNRFIKYIETNLNDNYNCVKIQGIQNPLEQSLLNLYNRRNLTTNLKQK